MRDAIHVTVTWTVGLRTCDGAILLPQRTELSPLTEIIYAKAVESDEDTSMKYRDHSMTLRGGWSVEKTNSVLDGFILATRAYKLDE